MKRVLVIGDTLLDKYVYGSVDRVSPEAPVLVFDYLSKEKILGGALNVCANIRTLFGTDLAVDYCGFYSFDVQSLCAEYDISLELTSIPVYPEDVLTKTRFVCKNHQIMRLDNKKLYSNENSFACKLRLADILKKNSYDLIVISDYNKGTLKECWDVLSSVRIPKLIDSKYSEFRCVDEQTIIKINSLEHESWRQEIIAKEIVITMGGNGYKLLNEGKWFPSISKDQEVVDVCGAGDVFLAGMAANYLDTGNFDACSMAAFGNIAAGEKVKRFGTVCVKREWLK